MVWEGPDRPEVSLIYFSRSTKAPKRKLQTNGPVTKKAKKKTSSSDSSEDSSEEEKAQGPPAKKAGKDWQGVVILGKGFVACLYHMADSYWDLYFIQLHLPNGPVFLSSLERLQPRHQRAAAAAAVKNPVMRKRTKRKSLFRFAALGRKGLD